MPDNKDPAQAKIDELEKKKFEEELAKLPSFEELQKEIDAIEAKKVALQEMQDVKANFGIDKKTRKDKGGRKEFNLPVMPASLGRITISGINFQGKMKLTWTQYQEYLYHLTNRVELEEKMRFGNSVQDEAVRALGAANRFAGRQGKVRNFQVTRSGETAEF